MEVSQNPGACVVFVEGHSQCIPTLCSTQKTVLEEERVESVLGGGRGGSGGSGGGDQGTSFTLFKTLHFPIPTTVLGEMVMSPNATTDR